MKLNPSKCMFDVTSDKFLGLMISQRGIEANTKKIQALQKMKPPRMIKEAQHLTGRIATLNRFLSRSIEKSLSFFKALK